MSKYFACCCLFVGLFSAALSGCGTGGKSSSPDARADSKAAATAASSEDDQASDDAPSELALQPSANGDSPATNSIEETAAEEDDDTGNMFLAYEVDAESLLAAALPPEQLQQGWVRLFDGQSPFGWFLTGTANWSIKDGAIRVSKGDMSFLCTSFQLADYELKVDFRCDADTNSGIFLRTGPEPDNVAEGCLELNIAPPDNPFPTGSFVQRQKLEPEDLNRASQDLKFDSTQWHTYHVRLVGNEVEVWLDGTSVLKMSDFSSNPVGHISLQHNQGRVEFRNIMLKPVSSQALRLDADWEQDWTKTVKEDAMMDVEVLDDGLRLTGGLGQLQSKQDYSDFILQASYTLAKPEVNSGIFFRCIRDNMLDGYECQVNHATVDGDPLMPADAGAGAIFRRQPARVVVGDGTTKSYITILANGAQFLTWVNGLQVADFYDSREPNENPRRGLRTDAGPISIQAHDPGTDVTYHELKIAEL